MLGHDGDIVQLCGFDEQGVEVKGPLAGNGFIQMQGKLLANDDVLGMDGADMGRQSRKDQERTRSPVWQNFS